MSELVLYVDGKKIDWATLLGELSAASIREAKYLAEVQGLGACGRFEQLFLSAFFVSILIQALLRRRLCGARFAADFHTAFGRVFYDVFTPKYEQSDEVEKEHYNNLLRYSVTWSNFLDKIMPLGDSSKPGSDDLELSVFLDFVRFRYPRAVPDAILNSNDELLARRLHMICTDLVDAFEKFSRIN